MVEICEDIYRLGKKKKKKGNVKDRCEIIMFVCCVDGKWKSGMQAGTDEHSIFDTDKLYCGSDLVFCFRVWSVYFWWMVHTLYLYGRNDSIS